MMKKKDKNIIKEMHSFFYGGTFTGMNVALLIFAMLFTYFISLSFIHELHNKVSDPLYKVIEYSVRGAVILFFVYRIIKVITGKNKKMEEDLEMAAGGENIKIIAHDFENAEQLFMGDLRIGDEYIFTKGDRMFFHIEDLESICMHKVLRFYKVDKSKNGACYKLEGVCKGKYIKLCDMCTLYGVDIEPTEAWMNAVRHLKNKNPNLIIEKKKRVSQEIIDDTER